MRWLPRNSLTSTATQPAPHPWASRCLSDLSPNSTVKKKLSGSPRETRSWVMAFLQILKHGWFTLFSARKIYSPSRPDWPQGWWFSIAHARSSQRTLWFPSHLLADKASSHWCPSGEHRDGNMRLICFDLYLESFVLSAGESFGLKLLGRRRRYNAPGSLEAEMCSLKPWV